MNARPDAHAIITALSCGRPGCQCHRSAQLGSGSTHCPAHDDKDPSLSVQTRNGRVLVHCHAGCAQNAVIAALRDRELWPSNDDSRTIAATYSYHDADGNLRYEVVRYDPKSFRQRRPDGNGGWIWGLDGVEPVLYHLPELIAADPDAPVFIPEGEKHVDRLRLLGLVATTNPMGAGKWRPEYSESLRDRHVIILPDNDEVGRRHAEQVAASMTGIATSVKIVDLPNLPPKGDIIDWLDDGGSLEALQILITEAKAWEPQRVLPTIVWTNRALRDVTQDTLQALVAANTPPVLFVRAGALVRVRTNERGRPIIETLTEPELRHRVARVADFVRITERGYLRQMSPPLDVIRDVMAAEEWPFPPLEAIAEVPVVRPEGSVLDRLGYDRATTLIYRPSAGIEIPPVSPEPTPENVTKALGLIDEAIRDFPYVDEASKTNTIALMLTPIVRPAIEGLVPLALIDKPQAGTGASLLAQVIALVSTGRPADMMGALKDDEEWRKQITAVLMAGATMIMIDNVDYPLASASLARALTASAWKDRILGRSETAVVPQTATWLATGNNIRLRGDIARRCYWIRMDAKTAQPWRRTDFRHPDLLAWVAEHRGELLWALLTLVRTWFAAGKPAAPVPALGGFEAWTRVVGGILAHAGLSGFLANLNALYEQADEEAGQWEAFLTAWESACGSEPLTVAELSAQIAKNAELAAALPDDLAETSKTEKEANYRRRLGKALAKRAGVRYGESGVRLERADSDTHKKVNRWRILRDMRDVADISPAELGASFEDDGRKTEEKAAATKSANPANPAAKREPLEDPQKVSSEGPDAPATPRISVKEAPSSAVTDPPGPGVPAQGTPIRLADLPRITARLMGETSVERRGPYPAPCHVCSGTRFWRGDGPRWICATCHPPAQPQLVREWYEP
jgi:hypothetical protein